MKFRPSNKIRDKCDKTFCQTLRVFSMSFTDQLKALRKTSHILFKFEQILFVNHTENKITRCVSIFEFDKTYVSRGN